MLNNCNKSVMSPNKHNHCIILSRNMLRSSNPLRNAIRRSSLVAGLTDKIVQIQEEHGMPSNKHYEIPFVRGMPCSSNPLRNAVTSSSLCGVPFYLNLQTQKSTTCSGANLTTVSVCVGICRALPFI